MMNRTLALLLALLSLTACTTDIPSETTVTTAAQTEAPTREAQFDQFKRNLLAEADPAAIAAWASMRGIDTADLTQWSVIDFVLHFDIPHKRLQESGLFTDEVLKELYTARWPHEDVLIQLYGMAAGQSNPADEDRLLLSGEFKGNLMSAQFTRPIYATVAEFEAAEQPDFYYIPAALPDGYALSQVQRESYAHITLTYAAPTGETLTCSMSLHYRDDEFARDYLYRDRGYASAERDGVTYYYRLSAEGVYAIGFAVDGELIQMRIPDQGSLDATLAYAEVKRIVNE